VFCIEAVLKCTAISTVSNKLVPMSIMPSRQRRNSGSCAINMCISSSSAAVSAAPITIYMTSLNWCTDSHTQAKVLCLGILYGMGAPQVAAKVSYSISMYVGCMCMNYSVAEQQLLV
jgi:hypothetical protein